MADLHVKLSDASEEFGVFHDWEYRRPERNRGGNSDSETYKVTNVSGNCLTVIVKDFSGNEYVFDQSIQELEFTIYGAIEIGDFEDLHKLRYKAAVVSNALSGRGNGVQEQV